MGCLRISEVVWIKRIRNTYAEEKKNERRRGRLIITRTDPTQKRIKVSDRSRGKAKILEPSSISQIHLWSKSQISHKQCQICLPEALAV